MLSDYYLFSAKLIHNQGEKDTEFGNAPVSDLLELKIEIAF